MRESIDGFRENIAGTERKYCWICMKLLLEFTENICGNQRNIFWKLEKILLVFREIFAGNICWEYEKIVAEVSRGYMKLAKLLLQIIESTAGIQRNLQKLLLEM